MTRTEQHLLHGTRELEQDLIQQAEERTVKMVQDLIQQLQERGIQIFPDLVRQARERGFAIGQDLNYQLWECGLLIGARRGLLRQLRFLFGSQVDDEPQRRVAAASREQIVLWAGRILSVQTLAEIFAD